MISAEILNKQLLAMTGNELITLLKSIQPTAYREENPASNRGKHIKGIAKTLDIGATKAQQLKNIGVFDDAIYSAPGEHIQFYKDKLIKCYESYNKYKL